MVRTLICLELILNLININLVTFFYLFDSRQLKRDIFAIFVALAAAEAAIGIGRIGKSPPHPNETNR